MEDPPATTSLSSFHRSSPYSIDRLALGLCVGNCYSAKVCLEHRIVAPVTSTEPEGEVWSLLVIGY
jgi:hypothetical protein